MRSHFKHNRLLRKSSRLRSGARTRASRVSSLRKSHLAFKQASSEATHLSPFQRLCSQQLYRVCGGITRLLPFKDALTRRWHLLARSHLQCPSHSSNANNNAEKSRNMIAKPGNRAIYIQKPLRRGCNYYDRKQSVISQIDKIHKVDFRGKERTRASNLFPARERNYRRDTIQYRSNGSKASTAPRSCRSRTPTPLRRRGRNPGTSKRKKVRTRWLTLNVKSVHTLNRQQNHNILDGQAYRMGTHFNEKWVCSPSSSRYKVTNISRNSSRACSRASSQSVLSRQQSCVSVSSRDMSYSNSSRCQMENGSQQFRHKIKKNSSKGASCCYPEDRSPYQSPFISTHYKRHSEKTLDRSSSSQFKSGFDHNRQNNHKKRTKRSHSSSSSGGSKSRQEYMSNKRSRYICNQPGQPRQRMLRRLFMCLVM